MSYCCCLDLSLSSLCPSPAPLLWGGACCDVLIKFYTKLCDSYTTLKKMSFFKACRQVFCGYTQLFCALLRESILFRQPSKHDGAKASQIVTTVMLTGTLQQSVSPAITAQFLLNRFLPSWRELVHSLSGHELVETCSLSIFLLFQLLPQSHLYKLFCRVNVSSLCLP